MFVVPGSLFPASGAFLQSVDNFFGALFAHVEHFDSAFVFGKGGVGCVEQPLHCALMTGGDAHGLICAGVGEQSLQARIATGGHFAEIGYALEGDSGVAEFFQDFILHIAGDNLGVGATAVENAGGRHGGLGRRDGETGDRKA